MTRARLFRNAWLWLLAAVPLSAATPQQHRHRANITPTQNVTTGVLTLPEAPNPPESLRLYVDGVRQKPGVDYTLSGAVISPVPETAAKYADATDVLVADYER